MTCPHETIDWKCRLEAGHSGKHEPGVLKAGVGPVPTGVPFDELYTDHGGEG